MTMRNETEKRNEMTDAKLIQALMSDIGVTYVSQEQFEQDNLPSGVHGAPRSCPCAGPPRRTTTENSGSSIATPSRLHKRRGF